MKQRPDIIKYTEPADIIRHMVNYRKQTEPAFSILQATKKIVGVSPALVSLILSGKREVTRDRVSGLCKLMGLRKTEIRYFRSLVERANLEKVPEPEQVSSKSFSRRKKIGNHILKKPLNVFVKDAFEIKEVRENNELIYSLLGGIASSKQIDESVEYLLKNNYLIRGVDNKLQLTNQVSVADNNIPSQSVRNFHKAILNNAKDALDVYSIDERLANAATMALTAEDYEHLCALIGDFSKKVQDLMEGLENKRGKRLYQLSINLCPTGGQV